MTINRKENFGVEGFRLQRNNSDGTIPTPLRMVGTAGSINATGLAGTETIILKEDSGAAASEAIDISGGTYVDGANATVAELVTELNIQIALGGPLNLTAEADATTGRLAFKLTTAGTTVKVQLYGTLISYLGFGEPDKDETLTGIGLKIVKGFDTTKSIGLPKNLRDKEEIENETGDGSLTSVVINAVIKGLTPAITCAKNDYELKQLIGQGVYDSTLNTYEPPTIANQAVTPSFNMEIFSPAYDKGSNLRTGMAGWEQVTLRSCSGYEGDVSKEVKAFTDCLFNLDAVEYNSEAGVKSSAYTEKMLTTAEYAILDVENV